MEEILPFRELRICDKSLLFLRIANIGDSEEIENYSICTESK